MGHKITSGAHNQFSEMRLREQGLDELADRLAAALGEDKPGAAYSHDEYQQAKRNDFDLPALRQSLKQMVELGRSDQPKALAKLIDRQGLELADAVQDGRGRSRINIELVGDLKPHNANRTLRVKAADVAKFIEKTREIRHDLRSDKEPYLAIERGPASGSTLGDHLWTGTDSQEQPKNDPSPKRTVEGAGGDSQELTSEAVELAIAAKYL